MINKYVRWAAKRIAQYMGRGRDIVAFDPNEFIERHPSDNYDNRINQRLWDMRSFPEFDRSQKGFTDEEDEVHGELGSKDRLYDRSYGLTPDAMMEYVVTSSGLVEGIYNAAVKVAADMNNEISRISEFGKRDWEKKNPDFENAISGFKRNSPIRIQKQIDIINELSQRLKGIGEKLEEKKAARAKADLENDELLRKLKDGLDKKQTEWDDFKTRKGIKNVKNLNNLSSADKAEFEKLSNELSKFNHKIKKLTEDKESRTSQLTGMEKEYESLKKELADEQNYLKELQRDNESLSKINGVTEADYARLLYKAFDDFSTFVEDSSAAKERILKFLLNNAKNIFGSIGDTTVDANTDPEELMRSMATSLMAFVNGGGSSSGKGLDSISKHMLYIARGGDATNFDGIATFLDYVRLMLRDAVKAVRRESKKLPKNLRGPTEHDEGNNRTVDNPLDAYPAQQTPDPSNYGATIVENYAQNTKFLDDLNKTLGEVVARYYKSSPLKLFIWNHFLANGLGAEVLLNPRQQFYLGDDFYVKLDDELKSNSQLKSDPLVQYKRRTKNNNPGDLMGIEEIKGVINHGLKASILRDIPKLLAVVMKIIEPAYPELKEAISMDELYKAFDRLMKERTPVERGQGGSEKTEREQDMFDRLWQDMKFRKNKYTRPDYQEQKPQNKPSEVKTSSISIATELKRVAELLADL